MSEEIRTMDEEYEKRKLKARIAELEEVVKHEQMCNSQMQIKLANCEIGRAHAYDDQDIAIQRCNRMQARITELNGDKASLNMTCDIQSIQLAEKNSVIAGLRTQILRYHGPMVADNWTEWAKAEATKDSTT